MNISQRRNTHFSVLEEALNVMSHNTHMTSADKYCSFWVTAPTTVTPTWPLRFPELSSTLELSCYQAPTCPIVYSIVFSHICHFPACAYPHVSDPVLICAYPVLILCFPFMYTSHCCVSSHTSDIPDFRLCLWFHYKTLTHVGNLTCLNIDFDYCSHCLLDIRSL